MNARNYYFFTKIFFLLLILFFSLAFSAVGQNYPFKESEKLAKEMMKAKVWGVGNSKAMADFIQTISDNEKVQVYILTGHYSESNPDSYKVKERISMSGQEVRDAYVIHQAYQLWRKGELKDQPEIQKMLAQKIGLFILGDPKDEKAKNMVWENVQPYYDIVGGHKLFVKFGYGDLRNNGDGRKFDKVVIQEYPFKESEKLAKLMIKAGIWGSGNYKDIADFIQTIPDNKQVRIWTFTGVYSTKENDGWNPDKVVSVSGQEVRDAFVIHQAYQLWSKGELKNHPEIEAILAQRLGLFSRVLGDPNNEKVKNDIKQTVVPYWNKLSGYKAFFVNGYGQLLNYECQQQPNQIAKICDFRGISAEGF